MGVNMAHYVLLEYDWTVYSINSKCSYSVIPR